MKTELEKLKKEIEADLAAVNQLLDRCEKQRESKPALASFIEASRPKRGTYEIVENLIKNHDGEFGINEIYFKLRTELGKEPSTEAARIISQVINKLKQRDEIEVIKAGIGRRSGIYQYKK